ncbi:MAG: hypothetical protein IJI61_00860 [Oscillospiraceae bacterium]|nr:hypothetical protein [Oscillospiraceae bacterium]
MHSVQQELLSVPQLELHTGYYLPGRQKTLVKQVACFRCLKNIRQTK